jgi:hypothetical protein
VSVRERLPTTLADVYADTGRLRSTTGDPAAVVGHLRDRPRLVREWLHESCGDDDLAKRSAWHHNGFAKILLHECLDPGFRVRLHVWPADTSGSGRRGDSDAHNHRWAFASSVLVGEGMDAEHFTVVETGGRLFRRYLVGPGIDGLMDAGPVRLSQTSRFVRPHEDVYECPTDVVHTIEPRGRGIAATLVVTRLPSRSVSSIFRHAGDVSDPGSRPLEPRELRRLLGVTIAAL